ncbi:MAG: PocR ligand-binding domain-containing protein [Lachnotalea sp.]
MISIKAGVIDLKCLEVEDIIDMKVLQYFLDNFALGMNCAAVSVNRVGEEITRPSHYRDFCSKFIHSNSLGDSKCATCHSQMGDESVKLGKPYVGSCHAGLIDFAAPIIIKGEHLGTILGGQILDSAPDKNTISNVAKELNLPEESLWEAATHIDIIPEKNIIAASDVLFTIANTLAQNGYNRIETELLSSNLAENFLQISQTVESLAESAQDITTNQQVLGEEISGIGAVTKEIANVLQSIKHVAAKTRMIGLNASIEAARIGNDGRGFAVVAKEIQNLSESSKNTAIQITDLTSQINDKINLTIENSQTTMGITEDQSAAMEELSATVQNSVRLAEELKRLFS